MIKGNGRVFRAMVTLKMVLSLVTSQLLRPVKCLVDASIASYVIFETGERILDLIPDLQDLCCAGILMEDMEIGEIFKKIHRPY